MSDLKSVVSAIRTGMDLLVELGTSRGVFFLCGLAAFLDATCSFLHAGNLMTLDWSARLGPGIVLLSLIVYLSVQFIAVLVFEAILVRVVGPFAVFIRRGSDHDPNREGYTANTLEDLAAFENDGALAEEVRAAKERWAREGEEAEQSMRLSLSSLIWLVVASCQDSSLAHETLLALASSPQPYWNVLAAGLMMSLIAVPWLSHLSTDPFAPRRLYGGFLSRRVETMRRTKLGLPPKKPAFRQ